MVRSFWASVALSILLSVAATAQVILAMSDWRLGHREEARTELASARGDIETQFRKGLERGSAPNGFWFDWVFAQILLREAEVLLAPLRPETAVLGQ